MKTSKRTPKLTRKIVTDDQALSDAIIEVLTRSKGWRKSCRKVVRAQDRLRRLANVDAWLSYLKLEEVTNARATIEADVLIRWAFEQGLRRSRR